MRLSLVCVFLLVLLCETVMAKPKESMCKHASLLQAYATLGDCYWYGVYYSKDTDKAKTFYLQGAMQNGEQGEYAKLRAGRTLLLDSTSPLENAMGLYILKEFSDKEAVEKTLNPEYVGDYTRRGTARYYLSIYLSQQEDFEGAKNYLNKSLEDNHGYAAFAIIYLHEAGKLSSPINSEKLREYMEEGEEKQRRFFFWQAEQGYSCWLQHQIDGSFQGAAFPVDHELVLRLLVTHGPCL